MPKHATPTLKQPPPSTSLVVSAIDATDAMNGDVSKVNGNTALPNNVTSDDNDILLQELRELLLSPEQRHLGTLQQRLDGDELADDVGRVLPQAIVARGSHDKLLPQALEPSVLEVIRSVARYQPQVLADVFFPILGPAIRRSIQSALARMLQSLNQTLDHSFSARGWRWRIEAWRSSKPFAEVVMLHSLAYSIEQVFLVHRETGILLQHVTLNGNEGSGDADMVSGMFSAIQDFARDSFQLDKETTLNTFQVGELTVLIEQGPQAFVAALVRGTPPASLGPLLQDTLESLHLRYSGLFADFTGDTSPFELTRPLLEANLEVKYREDAGNSGPKPMPIWLWPLSALVSALLLWWAWGTWQDNQRFNSYIASLRATAGLAITEINGRQISAMRDPLALVPKAPGNIRLKLVPYASLDPIIVLKRVKQLLDPPAGLQLYLKDETLTLIGAAPASWWREARLVARAIAGVRRLERGQLHLSDPTEAALAQRIVSERLFFRSKTGTPSPSESMQLERLGEWLGQFFLASERAELPLRPVELRCTTADDAIASARCGRDIRLALVRLGVRPDGLRLGLGSVAAVAAPYNRQVAFVVGE
jgi:hypothetical protein